MDFERRAMPVVRLPDRLPELGRGRHFSAEDGACAMEAASWLAAEPWSDHPKAVHPLVASIARAANDQLDDNERQALWPLILSSLGTNRSSGWRVRRRLRRVIRDHAVSAGGREYLMTNGRLLRALWLALIDECRRSPGEAAARDRAVEQVVPDPTYHAFG